MINIIKRAWNALAHPEIRLKADFPWSFGTMAKQYVIATILNIIGSLVPVFAFTLVLAYIARNNPDLAETLIGSDPKHPNMAILAVPVVLSFLAGFGLQLWYIRRCFHKAGLTLRQSVALNLDSLGGSWWSALWRAGVAFALVIGLEMLLSLLPLPKPEGPAEQLVRQIGAGWGFWAFAAIAVVGAPLFEEFVFRGFLFNV